RVGADRESFRRRGPGAGDPRGTLDGSLRAEATPRRDPHARPRARCERVARPPVRGPGSHRDHGSAVGTSIAPGMTELSHLGEAGDVRMVDVGGKPLSQRRAVARATVRMAPETARRLRDLPKGDALVTAQLAGILAAKRTSELIPLCHPLPLSHIDVSLAVQDGGVEITGTVETTAQTGVEMEALTAVSVAALTVYDMAKAV